MLCIDPKINRKLRAAVESGEINVENLLKYSTEERAIVLEKYIGKNYVENINKRFASKFNTELSDEALKDIIDSTARINKLRQSHSIKTTEEWNKLKMKDIPEWAMEYSRLQERISNHVNRKSTLGAIGTARAFIKEEIARVVDQTTIQGKVVQAVKSTFNILTSPIYKSLKASMDLSYALRQGFKVFTKSPKQWGDSMIDAFRFVKATGSKKKMDELMIAFKSYHLAHPNYDKLVGDGKLAFGIVEDWFPTTVAEKIPGLGNIFKSSNDAFTVFSQSARFGIANDMLEKQVKDVRRNLTKGELESIAYVANSVTGRGHLGRLEAISGHLNKLFFSARYISSQVDTFTMPFNQKLTPFARKEALNHSVKTLGTIGAIMATASFFYEVETDPRSSNFGKLRVGDTKNYLDLTVGLGSYITLAAKQMSGETKSSSTGKVTKLNTGKFGSQTRTDVLQQWVENKLAPAPGLINQAFGKGELYGGKEPNFYNIAKELVVPISAGNSVDYLQNEDSATALLLIMSDVSGIGVKTPY